MKKYRFTVVFIDDTQSCFDLEQATDDKALALTQNIIKNGYTGIEVSGSISPNHIKRVFFQ